MSLVRSNLKYIFVFVFTLFVMVFFGMYTNSWDAIWNYGFSYSMAKGELPYLDFTMIIPPFYNFIMSLGLIFISHNNIVFLIEQAILITVNFYFLYKMYDNRAWMLLPIMCFPIFVSFSPTYNYFLFFLTTIVLYLEEKKKSDYLIGFFLGLTLLTKYTVGIFLLFPSIIYYFKNKKKILKRFVGLTIPCIIFFIYLLITHSLYSFLDLCVFGLFDFASKNTVIHIVYFPLSLILFFVSLFVLTRNRKKILNWYVVFSFFIMIPNFSIYHFFVYVLFFSLLIISGKSILSGKYIRNISLLLSFLIIGLNIIFYINWNQMELGLERYHNINNFNYFVNSKGSKNSVMLANGVYKKYRAKGNTFFISNCGDIWMKIINEERTNYFTILNRGNYGYNGTKKMIKRIKKMNDVYFIVNMNDYKYSKDFSNSLTQFDSEIVEYIIKSSNFIESVNEYNVYYKQ